VTKRAQHYLSYLLRLWRSGAGAESTWRASLESPLTSERRGFASLKDLFAFLEAETGEMDRRDDEGDIYEQEE
jgi:hypothetical protein